MDYELYELGEYDDLTRRFENLDAPKSHGYAAAFISDKPKTPEKIQA